MAVGALAVADVGILFLPGDQAPAHGPGQRWGSAEGRGHEVVRGRNDDAPRSLRAKYPLKGTSAARPAVRGNKAEVTTPPRPKVTGFDREMSKEILARRDAHSRTYANEDGTSTTEISTSPLNYRDAHGAWRGIDSSLVEEGDGWANTADSVDVRFADRADAGELSSVTLPTGESFGYALNGAASVAGTADGARVSYGQVHPDTDLWLDSQAGGAKETLVLKSAKAPNSFLFPLHLDGLTARADGGSILLTDAEGRTRAVVPAGFMEDAGQAVSHAVTYELVRARGRPGRRPRRRPGAEGDRRP
ncbi:hypothetical protein ACGFYV_14665 [Streptomyces sp. NPDC048297]|uniref:hypothetical protein n=1 Tax=Streptomyces sp. NPDC048297 TaxID=3365531 RepID=UPI00371D7170